MRLAISGIVVALVLSFSLTAHGQISIGVSVSTAPPPLPEYSQPPIPEPGFIWVPGYWAWDDDGYYWVPGTWVEPPEPGLLWTPGWWGWEGGLFVFHEGYWAPQVGFYGGINYGYGYSGNGYDGGYWRDQQFYYNRSVTNISTTTNITNVYNKTVVNTSENHVSFNGGQGGVAAQPTQEQRMAANVHHAAPTAAQTQQIHLAAQNREQRASANGGKPPIAATQKPAEFKGREAVAARSAGGPVPREQPRNAQTGNAPAPATQQREQEQRAQAGQQQQRAQADRQQRAQAEQQQRAQAEQQQRAQAEQQQRAQAEQQQRAQAEQQQRAQAEQQQRAQAAQQRRAPTEQPPRNIREAQAPPEKRSGAKPSNEKEQEHSRQQKPSEESPPH